MKVSVSQKIRAALEGPGKRIGWGLADQGLSSLTNFVVGIVIAKSVGLDEFGAYALAFSAYCLVLGVSRALTTEPFAVRYSSVAGVASKAAAGNAAGTALLLGTAAAAVALVSSLFLPAQYRGLVLALSAVLPGIILQDSWRLLFFARGYGRAAFGNDLIWTILLVPAFALDFLDGQVSSASLLLAWGSAGTLAGIYGILQFRAWPAPVAAARWLTETRALWPRYLCEGLAINGSQQVYMFGLAGLTGLASVGAFKLVLVVLGPVNVLVQGIGAVAVPEASRAWAKGRKQLNLTAVAFSLVVSVGALCWGTVVSAVPEVWLEATVGAGWTAAAVLLMPVMLSQVFNGANTGPVAALRAMGQAKRSMWTRIVASFLVLVLVLLGALAGGIRAAAWGLAAAALMNLGMWLHQFRRAAVMQAASGNDLDRKLAGAAMPALAAKTSEPGRGKHA